MAQVSEKLSKRWHDVMHAVYKLYKGVKIDVDNATLIYGGYTIKSFIVNDQYIEVSVYVKEVQILAIRDTGNIAMIKKHLRIAIKK